MKSIRIVSRLDIKGSNVVKGINTEGLRVVGVPKDFAEKYYAQGVDEIIYMDIVASLYDRNLDFNQLKNFAENIFIPITVGGGIRSIKDINNALRAGADKVAINTYAVKNPNFLEEAVHVFGSQCVVLSIEAKKISEDKWEAYTEGGREKTGINAIDWIKKALEFGVGEILITSIDKDGTQSGFDIDLIKKITEFATVPIIVHGGAGNLSDITNVIKIGRVDAVSASSIYHYNMYTVEDVKKELISKGIPIRNIWKLKK